MFARQKNFSEFVSAKSGTHHIFQYLLLLTNWCDTLPPEHTGTWHRGWRETAWRWRMLPRKLEGRKTGRSLFCCKSYRDHLYRIMAINFNTCTTVGSCARVTRTLSAYESELWSLKVSTTLVCSSVFHSIFHRSSALSLCFLFTCVCVCVGEIHSHCLFNLVSSCLSVIFPYFGCFVFTKMK